MKPLLKTLILTCGILFCLDTWGQSTPPKYNYAEVIIQQKAVGKEKSEPNVVVNFGEAYAVQIKNKEEIMSKVSSFTNGIDICNYLNDNGWEYVEKETILSTYVTFVIYTFKKLKE